MVGYAVAEEPADGGVAVFFGGGKLARDLSLPALRDRWRAGEAERQEAAAEWAGRAPVTGVHEGPRAGGHVTYRWPEASRCWGKTALREEHRAPAQRCPARWREATRRPGRSVARVGRRSRRRRDHLASGRLRRGGGAGCLIGALGARSRATGPRLGPAGPIGPRASAKAGESSLRRAWHHQVGGRPHGPSGPGRGARRTLGGSSWPRCSG